MNLLLLLPEELRPDGIAELTGRRLVHAREVLRAGEGDALRVGVVGGRIGTGQILRLDDRALVLRFEAREEPPPRAGVDLLLALPRPKALRKVLPAVASLGVDRVVLLNAARVEKSFWGASALAEARALMLLGLEQARDTRLPELLVRERFRPFVEDELDGLVGSVSRLLAHPHAPALAGRPVDRFALAIGPEGGWVPFELDLLKTYGFTPFSLGPRPLRVEVAVPYALGALRSA
jgi:RsmE family RNA methyltransferase